MTEETETETKYTARDIVDAAMDQKPATVSQAYSDLVLDRVHDLVQAKRIEVAQMFGKPDPEAGKGENSGSGQAA